jgi:hypothetical protein
MAFEESQHTARLLNAAQRQKPARVSAGLCCPLLRKAHFLRWPCNPGTATELVNGEEVSHTCMFSKMCALGIPFSDCNRDPTLRGHWSLAMQPTNSIEDQARLTVAPVPWDLSLFQDIALTF